MKGIIESESENSVLQTYIFPLGAMYVHGLFTYQGMQEVSKNRNRKFNFLTSNSSCEGSIVFRITTPRS